MGKTKSSSSSHGSGSTKSSKIKKEPRIPRMTINSRLIEYYQERMNAMMEAMDQYTETDQSVIIERVGIAQFYYGSYHDAMSTLSQALKLREKQQYTRSNARMQVLIGTIKFRIGDLAGAESMFNDVIKYGLKKFPDLAVNAYANLALVHYAQDRSHVKACVDNAKKGLELAVKLAKGTKLLQ